MHWVWKTEMEPTDQHLKNNFVGLFSPQIYPNLEKVTFNYLGSFRVGSFYLSEEKQKTP